MTNGNGGNEYPNNAWEWLYKIAKDFGIGTVLLALVIWKGAPWFARQGELLVTGHLNYLARNVEALDGFQETQYEMQQALKEQGNTLERMAEDLSITCRAARAALDESGDNN